MGVAVDSNGDVFTMDTAAGKFTEISGGTTIPLAGTLPANPAQLALDLAGNLYAAGSGASALTKLTLTGSTYVAGVYSVPGVTTPQAVAVDSMGNLYVGDKATASVYKIAAATVTGTSPPNFNVWGPVATVKFCCA